MAAHHQPVRLATLIELASGWQHQPLRYTDNTPEPDPDLRMTPRF